ncbi:MAG: SDR family oxidoreductase [Ignavibacteria bacterium]|nr:SDR family oxidoreductase [Ignavibacteria bacterium]
MDDYYIFDKNIWITGASSGIGYEIVKALSNYNTNLILSARNVDTLTSTATAITGKAKMYAFPMDVSNTQSVNDTFEFISHEIGFPDILINNAGYYHANAFLEITEEEFDKLIGTNLKGVFNTTRCVLPAMMEAGGGAVINICSIAALKEFKYATIYSAAKAGMLAMMNTLREEVRSHNIKIINIIPGATATPIWSPKILDRHKHSMCSAADVANTIIAALKLCNTDTAMIEEIVVTPQIQMGNF